MKYKVHRFSLRMTPDPKKLGAFLNSFEGDLATIIPNMTPLTTLHATNDDFVLIVERLFNEKE